MSKIKYIIKKMLIIFSIIIFLGIIILNLIYVANTASLEKISIEYVTITRILISIIIAAGIIIISYYLNKIKCKKVVKNIIIVILIFSYIIAQIKWSNTTIGKPSGDQRVIYDMAKNYIDGNKESLYQSEYLSKCPQQRSLLVMYIIIMKIVNSTDYVWLYLTNILANVLSIYALYLILKRLSKDYSVNKVLFAILSLTFIPLILLCNFIYGDLIGLTLILFAVYFIMQYTQKDKTIFILISAVLASGSLMFRMQNIIFVMAILIYLFLNFKRDFIVKEIVFIIVFCLIVFIPYKLVGDYLTNKLELDKEVAIPNSAYLYMAMYDGEKGPGWYSGSVMDVAQTDMKSAKDYYPPLLKERTKELVTHPFEAIRFYKNKIVSMWTDNTFQSIFYNMPVYLDGQPKEAYDEAIQESEYYSNYFVDKGTVQIKIYMKAIVILVFALSLLFLINYRKNISNEAILMITIFLGGFAFHILWEAKARYIIPYFVVLIPIACIQLNKKIFEIQIIGDFKNLHKKIKNINKNNINN